MPDFEDPPAKFARSDSSSRERSDASLVSPTGTLVSKSFYGGFKTHYLTPLERKDIAHIKENKVLPSATTPVVTFPEQNPPLNQIKKQKENSRKWGVMQFTKGKPGRKYTKLKEMKKPLMVKSVNVTSYKPLGDKDKEDNQEKNHYPGEAAKGKLMKKLTKLGSTAPGAKGTKPVSSLAVSSISALAKNIGKRYDDQNAFGFYFASTGSESPLDEANTGENSPGKELRRSPRKRDITPRKSCAKKPFVNPFSQDLFDDRPTKSPKAPEFWRITVNGVSSPTMGSQQKRHRAENGDSGLRFSQNIATVNAISRASEDSVPDSMTLLKSITPRGSPATSIPSTPRRVLSNTPSTHRTPLLFDSKSKNSTPQGSSSAGAVPGSPSTVSGTVQYDQFSTLRVIETQCIFGMRSLVREKACDGTFEFRRPLFYNKC